MVRSIQFKKGLIIFFIFVVVPIFSFSLYSLKSHFDPFSYNFFNCYGPRFQLHNIIYILIF